MAEHSPCIISVESCKHMEVHLESPRIRVQEFSGARGTSFVPSYNSVSELSLVSDTEEFDAIRSFYKP